MATFSGAFFLLFPFVVVTAAFRPPKCQEVECPTYYLIRWGDDYEIRLYQPAVWVSTPPIKSETFSIVSEDGRSRLSDYANGGNKQKKHLTTTAPAVTTVDPVDELVSSFTSLLFVPRADQAAPPESDGLEVRRTGTQYVAVRQFDGYADNGEVVKEAAFAKASVNGTIWERAVNEAKGYAVAQYNEPDDDSPDRLNEIWIPFVWV